MATRPILAISAGLTVAAVAYASGDQVGSEFSFAGAVGNPGGRGLINAVHVIDEANVLPAFDLMLFSAVTTPAADNAAATWSAADARKFCGLIKFAGTDMTTVGAQKFGTLLPVNGSFTFHCASQGTTLFADIVTRGAIAQFVAATDVRIILEIQET